MNLISFLKEYQEQHHFNNAYMAEKLNISEQLYGHYRKGKRNPKVDFYLKFKQAFGVDLLPEINNNDDVIRLLKSIEKRLIKIEKALKI